ncbi:hypothetical protein VNO80_25414 [Phaseolus coccineus]|uniref:Uncharacterized protein n=1 Tax=Phaseolus coccineus TaxID=3886 RepID=A0AAN9LU80_PHACN
MAIQFLFNYDAHENEEGLVFNSGPIFLFLMIIASLSIISIIIFVCGDHNTRSKHHKGFADGDGGNGGDGDGGGGDVVGGGDVSGGGFGSGDGGGTCAGCNNVGVC